MSHIELPAPIAALVDAINRGDTEAFVDAFTPDGLVDDWGRVLRGPDKLRSWAATDAIGMDARMTVVETHDEPDGTVRIVFDWASRRFNGRSQAYVTVTGDRVSIFRIPAH